MTSANGRVAATEPIEGLVEATNESGIRIAGAWLNRSKFHPVQLPEPGARVHAEVDPKGFLRSVEVLEPGADSPAPSTREQAITRLAVLKAAAAFGASRPDLKSSEILMIADKWLAWVERDA